LVFVNPDHHQGKDDREPEKEGSERLRWRRRHSDPQYEQNEPDDSCHAGGDDEKIAREPRRRFLGAENPGLDLRLLALKRERALGVGLERVYGSVVARDQHGPAHCRFLSRIDRRFVATRCLSTSIFIASDRKSGLAAFRTRMREILS